MSDPENFLSRWSRRKLDTEQEASPSARPAEASAKAESGDPESDKTEPQTTESAALDSRLRGNERNSDFDDGKEPEFDLSTLPSLDSITAETDVRVFLQKGIPADLTRAALRRAWTADPNIRDFMEVAENQWDFATGSDIPGFGPMRATDDIRQMLADIFGDGPKPPTEAEAKTADKVEPPAESVQSDIADRAAEPPEEQDIAALPKDQPAPEEAPVAPEDSVVRRGEVNIALQQNNQNDEYEPLPTHRPHGRALPQ
jgi:hypothetical protein